MYAFITVDPVDQTEGIIGMMLGGQYMPLVGADLERVEALRPHAQNIANVQGAEIKICLFSERVDIEIIKPK